MTTITTQGNTTTVVVKDELKYYKALLNQSGQNQPTVTRVLQNDLDGEVTFGYNTAGSYSYTLPGLVPFNKIIPGAMRVVASDGNATIVASIAVDEDSIGSIVVKNLSTGEQVDGQLYNYLFEIAVLS